MKIKCEPCTIIAVLGIAFFLMALPQDAFSQVPGIPVIIDGECYTMTGGHEEEHWSCFRLDPFGQGPYTTFQGALNECSEITSHAISGYQGPTVTLTFLKTACDNVPPSGGFELGWVPPDISGLDRIKFWWSDEQGNSESTAYDTSTEITPDQLYLRDMGDPPSPCVYAKLYVGGVKQDDTKLLECSPTNVQLDWNITPPTNNSVVLSWVAPIENDCNFPGAPDPCPSLDDLAGFKVYGREGSSPRTQLSAVNDPGATVTIINGLTDGSWIFEVTAYDTSGNESNFSNEATKSLP